MADPIDALDDLVQVLKQQRDELALQIHLAKAEAKDEWQELEQKLGDLEAKLHAAQHEAKSAAGNVVQAANLLGDEIAKAYKRIMKSLS